jgi:ElaB/YqjD/DUF883 family membrane-anchored ribosome-binding protein
MTALSTDFGKPARKASRASKAAAKAARATAQAVAAEARTFGRRSTRHLQAGAAKGMKHAMIVRGAGEDAAEIARERLSAALEALQQSSAEMSRWAGSKANDARRQAAAAVHERPVGSLASMLMVGALLGLLTSLVLRRD